MFVGILVLFCFTFPAGIHGLLETERVVSKIRDIIETYQIQHVNLFFGRSLNNLTFSDQLMLEEIPEVTKVVITKQMPARILENFINKEKSLSVVYFEFWNFGVFDSVQLALGAFRPTTKIICIQFGKMWKLREISHFFNLAKNIHILNSILMTNQHGNDGEVYAFDPFPQLQIGNMKNSSTDKLFLPIYKNFNGLRLKTVVFEDIPRTVFDRNNGEIFGTGATPLQEFIKYANCTLGSLQKVEMTNIGQLVDSGRIDITMNSIPMRLSAVSDAVHPLRIVKTCVIMPMRNKIPSYMYLIQPFQSNVWILIVITIFCLSGILHFTRILNSGRSEHGDAFCEIMKALLCLSFPKDFAQKKFIIRLICVKIFVLGFVLTNIYLAFSTSFFTKTVYGPQVETFEDMMKLDMKLRVSRLMEKDLDRLKKIVTVLLKWKASLISYFYSKRKKEKKVIVL